MATKEIVVDLLVDGDLTVNGDITLVDSGGYFDDNNVEAALQQVGEHEINVSNPHEVSTEQIDTNTTNFNTLLSATDTTVQKALDTLDNHSHTSSSTVVTYLDRYTLSADSSTATINIPQYDHTTDTLITYINSVYISAEEEYSITNNTTITKSSGTWLDEDIFDFVVIKNVATTSATGLVDKISMSISSGGGVLSTGVVGDIEIPYACEINAVTILGDQTGSIVIDIWKDTYDNYPPTSTDSITASAKPTISTNIKSKDTTLTGWTKTISTGDILRFNIDSVTAFTQINLILKVTRI